MLDIWEKNTAAYSEYLTIIPFPCASLLRYVCLVEYKTDNVRNNEALSRNHCYRGKAVSVTKSEWAFVALAIQHAKRRSCIVLSYVAWQTVPYFSTLFLKLHDFRGRGWGLTEHKMFVFTFSTVFFFGNMSHSKTQRSITNILWYSCKVLTIAVVGF